MFCPSCGLQEKDSNQFCRACGSNLYAVRSALAQPDSITGAATAARDEIGRAIAFKIREAKSAGELATVAEDVLPEIEKFLESPEERRLRRLRAGTLVAAIGAGATIAFVIFASIVDKELFVLAGMGLVCFFIGLGLLLNGWLFTAPKKTLSDKSADANKQRALDAQPATSELVLPEANEFVHSVTENTTRQLKEKQLVPRE